MLEMGMRQVPDDLFFTLAAMKHGGTSRMSARAVVDVPRYIEMAREFHRICAARPFLNHCIVARDVGARAFQISNDQLLARSREGDQTETRQKIMAFACVVTGASFRQVGATFERDHSAVSYACDKYADYIRTAIERA
jgi:hypothetical protein